MILSSYRIWYKYMYICDSRFILNLQVSKIKVGVQKLRSSLLITRRKRLIKRRGAPVLEEHLQLCSSVDHLHQHTTDSSSTLLPRNLCATPSPCHCSRCHFHNQLISFCSRLSPTENLLLPLCSFLCFQPSDNRCTSATRQTLPWEQLSPTTGSTTTVKTLTSKTALATAPNRVVALIFRSHHHVHTVSLAGICVPCVSRPSRCNANTCINPSKSLAHQLQRRNSHVKLVRID